MLINKLGARHITREEVISSLSAFSSSVQSVFQQEIGTMELAWKEPACITEVELNVLSGYIRNQEVCWSSTLWRCELTREIVACCELDRGFVKTDV